MTARYMSTTYNSNHIRHPVLPLRYLARNPIDAVKVRETKLTQQRLRCR